MRSATGRLVCLVVAAVLSLPVGAWSADRTGGRSAHADSLLAGARGAGWSIPAAHPRLLIHREDLPAIRFRCGIDRYRDDPVAANRGLAFGAQREVRARLEAAAKDLMRYHARPGDLLVPAFLHLVSGELGRPDEFTRYVAGELLEPSVRRFEIDAVVALDYCWEAIEPAERRRIAEKLAAALETIDPKQSPLDHFSFYRRLCSVAGAIVLHDAQAGADPPGAAGQVAAVLNLAQNYLEGPFLDACRACGPVPTSGENGIQAEADGVLAAEIWRSGAGRNLWPELADSLGRAMEHYFYADTEYPGLDHGFIHDDGTRVPLRPGTVYEGFAPAVPWAIACWTRDPIATWYAARSLPAAAPGSSTEVDRYQWIRLVYEPMTQAEVARRACPLGRQLGGGWVVMRSGWAGADTVLLFDAGQPFLRARQHFDAGQFQIYRKGRLAIDAGDDVTYEAVTSRGGSTTIGGQPGDWDQFLQATIAHNCVTVADPTYQMSLYGRPWLALGNQRLIEHDYDPSAGEPAASQRQTGTLTAFATNSFYSYAAADLSAAYPKDLVRSLQREILFVNAGLVLVLDRVVATRVRSIKTWHLQLPSRPLIDGQPLSTAHQLHGTDDQAGIWELAPHQTWMQVTQLDGRLFVRTLWPPEAQRRLVGGPMRARQIPGGLLAGRTYFGGEQFGYEHRLKPAWFLQAPNAAYTLGQPAGLGPQFGASATWGRLDVAPLDKTETATFLHLLVPSDTTTENPPAVRFETRDRRALLEVELPGQQVHVELPLDCGPGGRITLRDPATSATLFEEMLSATITPNPPIPGAPMPDNSGYR